MPTAADLRADVARYRVRIYEIAPRVGLHPVKLGAILNERAPLSPELAARIAEAVKRTAERRSR